ncbi:MAG: multifunctional oxoglutarate decarboxylase/oxoglutarate dehydrogenase thiamine pyrophosphate-binding subunit/dihydrolipoyllysine-residue succinyltransferase subunit [Planctomycetota bacterium]
MGDDARTIDFEALFGVNAGYVEKLFADYRQAPQSVAEEWRHFFEQHFGGGNGAAAAAPAVRSPAVDLPAGIEPLRGVAARIVTNMEESLRVPTATSTRVIPVKVLEENRHVVNRHLAAQHLGKASFTHFVAWAMVRALQRVPAMTVAYVEIDGKPHRRTVGAINLGMAVDVQRDSGRQLVVPNIKDCGRMTFGQFLDAYNAQIHSARTGKLTPEDFRETTCTLTNPGPLGTVSSLPRLMSGQSFIFATGAIDVPAEYQGASESTLNELGVSRVMTVTSTYDHRVIQGADSGEFLAQMHALLTGADTSFYDEVFADLKIPFRPLGFMRDRRPAVGSPLRRQDDMERAARVLQYVRAYRVRGYLLANLDPLEYQIRSFPELEMSHYGLSLWDLDREFFTNNLAGKPIAKLREIHEVLHATYTRHVGVEFMHIADPEQKEWLRTRLEGTRFEDELPREVTLRVLDKLVEAEAFERFLHTRFVGHKRFSLEGCETVIPVLDALLNHAADAGIERAVLGMAHRGRLNVLAHILGKSLQRIFSEFEGHIDPKTTQGSGDVKYHLGSSSSYTTMSGKAIDVELASNPSHLEAVDPVVEGMARARQDQLGGDDRRAHVLPVLVHGDAAFAGQGVVAEILNMSQLRGYRTGGTVHIIVNNQIGYTTLPADARSTPFCTDVAKSIQAPVFHVNGDDPLSAVRCIRLALEYRQRFERDVVVDIVGYRRHGHNEGDEPSFTQPLMYKTIEAHRTVREIFQDFLVRAKVLQPDEVERFNEVLHDRYRTALKEVRDTSAPGTPLPRAEVREDDLAWEHATPAVATSELLELAQRLAQLPADFDPHDKVRSILDRRVKMAQGEQPVDFALAETLAFATLLRDGVPVRLAGQDSGRGTFSQRHSVLLDESNGHKYIPLNFLSDSQAKYVVVDSLLSEEAALGFEYGYSVAAPRGLTLWEAQFGDFCNGAQIQIDQFIAAGEAKWGQATSLVLLLPHGYDGQGPEHSSARLERFLQLCAEDNMRVAYPSTAGRYYHLLRRQALDPRRKPLVVMTPKSLLRDRAAGSAIDELGAGAFQAVVEDPVVERGSARRVILCTGKIYHELAAARREWDVRDVALVRVELLYPWPTAALRALFSTQPAAEVIWCQEEPANMGALRHARWHCDAIAAWVARRPSASPATGSLQAHKREQAELLERALRG